MVSLVRILLGVIYFVLFVMSVPWFFNIPLKDDEGFLGFYGVWAVNFILTISLLILSFGFLANKRWVVVLYWIYCVPWVLMFTVPLFSGEYLFLNSLGKVVEVVVLVFGPPALGLFLWRQMDTFTPGFFPLSWQRSFTGEDIPLTEKKF